jgi:rhodanese-related sulfurtransferase
MNTITPQRLNELMQGNSKIDLIDVRTPIEYASSHASGARLIPLHRLDVPSVLTTRAASKNDPVYLICKSGARAKRAREKFEHANFPHAVIVEGGTEAWASAGLPLQCCSRRMSMERQTRIGAGTLVLTGAALGAFVHPAFFGLCALVGTGLVFAGVTDICLMSMLFARMPWNER